MEMENWPKNLEVLKFLNVEELGFTRIINAITRSKELSFGEKVILNALLSHTLDFRQCYAKHSTLAHECGCSISTIKRHLNSLKDKTVIDWEKTGFGRCNQYFINPTISELIEKIVHLNTSSNSIGDGPPIRSQVGYQLGRPRANESITTIENKTFNKTSDTSRVNKFENYDCPLSDATLEGEAVYLAQRLKEEGTIPKYRHVVKRYKRETIEKALSATIDCESSSKLKVTLAAYFWGTLKSIGGEGDRYD